MTQQVLALKWRPRTFNEVIGQPHVVQALSNGLDNNRLHHAFLFTGTRGVGKTTLARIFAKSLNCEKGVTSTPCGVCSICREVDEGRFVDLIEIDAASRTRVEDTREILDNVQYAPTRGRYKIYLIDEVHMLSNSSFNALLKTLEEPPGHVKFLLATTDPQKLPVTVLSRCLRFQLKRINDQEIAGQLEKILTAEGIPFEDEALKIISKAGDGSMRDALSLLDQAIAYGGQQVLYPATHEMLGLIDTQYLIRTLEALATKDSSVVISTLNALKANGLDYYRFLEDLIDVFHLLTMIQLSEEFASTESDDLVRIANLFSAEDLQLFYQVALNGRKDLQNHPNSAVGFEMTLLRMVLFAPHAPIGIADTQKADTQKKNLRTPNSPSVEVPTTNALPAIDAVDNNSTLHTSTSDSTPESVDLPWVVEKEIDAEHYKPEHRTVIVEKSDNASIIKNEILGDKVDDNRSVINSSEELIVIHQDNVTEKSVDSGAESIHTTHLIDAPSFMIEEGSESRVIANHVDSGDSLLQGPATNVLNDLSNNESWLSLVSSLSLESVLSGIAHSLVFKSFDGKNLILERPLSVQAFRVDEAEVRLAMAISHKLKTDIICKIEYVERLDVENLHARTERLDEERLQKALADFREDPVVQYLKNELQAVLLDKTLKPID